ncbi:DUF4362 domain-containing protein [Paenibacillus rigui]|nr:DUF4362 domain-containing protein [Paenibacillus rigui]
MKNGVTRMVAAILFMLALTACQKADLSPNGGRASLPPKASYPSEKAIGQGDVVDVHGKYTNLERWDQFVKDVEGKKAGKVRITRYTIEGDPIIYDLAYDNGRIKYEFDNSMDTFAGQGKGKASATCQSIEKKQEANGTMYSLEGCSSSTGETFGFLVQREK